MKHPKNEVGGMMEKGRKYVELDTVEMYETTI